MSKSLVKLEFRAAWSSVIFQRKQSWKNSAWLGKSSNKALNFSISMFQNQRVVVEELFFSLSFKGVDLSLVLFLLFCPLSMSLSLLVFVSVFVFLFVFLFVLSLSSSLTVFLTLPYDVTCWCNRKVSSEKPVGVSWFQNLVSFETMHSSYLELSRMLCLTFMILFLSAFNILLVVRIFKQL